MYKKITEEGITIKIPEEEKISKKLPVFYNPIMKLNRDITIAILKIHPQKKIALPLAGTGIRGIRTLKETKSEVWMNDHNEKATKLIKENLKLNQITKRYEISNKDANEFLIQNTGFDYIDIDPFGSPNFLLASAIRALSRKGILAVTATDTGCLAGSFPKACKRKYWATPQRNETMHENGLRILIRKIQLIGAENEKALTPIYSYAKDHYYRTFLICEKGKQKCDEIIEQHGRYKETGPLWKGQLWDEKTATKIAKLIGEKTVQQIKEESKIKTIGFYNLPQFCKKNKLTNIKQEIIIKKINEKGYSAAETHLAPNSIRSDIPEKELKKIF